MTFGSQVLDFYLNLGKLPKVPSGVGVLNPFQNTDTQVVVTKFFGKFYHDNNQRILLIPINPGRFGSGVTGIPFTDPIQLEAACGIDNDFKKRTELSSRFIYKMIEELGGVDDFYSKFYFSSVSPLGFVKDGKNLNYYDLPELQNNWEAFMLNNLRNKIEFGASSKIAFVIGRGKNFKYMNYLNKKYQLFDKLIDLPHPRWVMQYRLKRIDEFILEYKEKLEEGLTY